MAGAPLLLDDTRFDAHAPLAYHPERPERLVAARHGIAKVETAWTRVDPREATDEELVRVHDARFIEKLRALEGSRGHLDPDTYVAPDSVKAARLAAGGVVKMVDALLAGEATRGLALVRPPGHHARPSRAMGFCLLNNVAVAAAHARAKGLDRVLIVDWDVHHGNGTQEIFFRDPNVLYASTHQFPFYPGTGDADETGEGDGDGFTVNVPLAAGGGDGVYRSAFERVVLPVAEAFKPQLVLVSAGFDAAARDPLAQMEVTPRTYAWMAARLRDIADATAGGKMLMLLEGGYDLVALEACLREATIGMLEGDRENEAGETKMAEREDDEGIGRAQTEARRVWSGAL